MTERIKVWLIPPLCEVCGVSLKYHAEEDAIHCGLEDWPYN